MKTWKERIEEAKENGFTEEDRRMSSCWHTCATSELPSTLKNWGVFSPRDDGLSRLGLLFTNAVAIGNAPEDTDLIHLGARFAGCVHGNRVREAEQFYNEIHRRANEILKETE